MSNALSLHDGVFLRAGLDVNCRKALYPPPPRLGGPPRPRLSTNGS